MPDAAAFHARLVQAGLPVTAAESAAVLPAWEKLGAWLELLRTPVIPPEAEPAVTFRADEP